MLEGLERIELILLLGMGSIMRSLMELLKVENHELLKKNMICICPEKIPKYIYDIKPDLKHKKIYITSKNVNEIIGKLLNVNVLVIDLTVNVESIDIIKLCKLSNTLYINTSLEQYQTTYTDIEKSLLYYNEILLEKEVKNISNNPTIIHSMGINPGSISSLVYQGIESYCKSYAKDKLILLNKNEFNKVASDILDMIHISEYDNQQLTYNMTKLIDKYGSNIMINSWSSIGYIAEALGYSFVSSKDKIKDYKRSKYNRQMYYSEKYKSMDCETDSICLYPDGKEFSYIGKMITHFEVISLSKYLSFGDYIPKISYVYSSSPISQKCLDNIKDNNYKIPKHNIVFMQEDIINKDSFDSLGATLFFRDGRKFWCGSVLTNAQTQSLLGKYTHSNATQLQVSISMLCGIEWMLENPEKGIITSEEIPYKYVLKRCIPYWGNFYCKEITQTKNTYNKEHIFNPNTIHIDNIL